MEDVYTARLEKLWEERFAELGYREFKQKLNGGTLWGRFPCSVCG